MALIGETEAKVAALVSERDALAVSVKEATAKAEATAAELDKVRGELAKAQGELRNPAIKAANIAETTSAPSGDAGGATQSKAQMDAEYNKIEGRDSRETAKLRAEFRKAHARELGL